MKSKLIILTGLLALTSIAAPMTAHAQAPVKRLRVMAAPQPRLTNVPSVGFVTAKVPSVALPVQQQWREIPGSGPAVFYQSVNGDKCLRASPATNVLVSTATCDFSNSSTSKQQQWIHSGTGQLANLDRLVRGIRENSLAVDFANINTKVQMERFTGAAHQRWIEF
jgi:hypothetical protein